MAYFIFNKNSDNLEGTLYRIAENQSDFTNLNINSSDYKIIEVSQENFNLVKYGSKSAIKYNNNTITYIDNINLFNEKKQLQFCINNFKNSIQQFTAVNKNNPLFDRWNNYYNQLNSLNLDNLTYPFNKSLEQYFNDLGQPSYNILQLP